MKDKTTKITILRFMRSISEKLVEFNLVLMESLLKLLSLVASLISVFAIAFFLKNSTEKYYVIAAIAIATSILAALITTLAKPIIGRFGTKPRKKVFLSYVREDEEKALELYQKLTEEGFEPWMDVKELTGGENWMRAIQQAIRQSDYMIVLTSKNSLDKNGYLQREAKFGLDLSNEIPEHQVLIIPARVDHSTIPYELQNIQWVDLFDKNGFQNLFTTLRSERKAS